MQSVESKTKPVKKHRFFKILGALALLVVAVIAVDAGINKLTDATEASLPRADRQALAELSEYIASENDGDSSWQGISVAEHPILVISKDSQYAYLVNPHSDVSSLFARSVTMNSASDEMKVWRLSRLYPRLWSVKLLGGNFNTIGQETTVLGNDVYYVKFDDESMSVQYSSEHFITFLAHESFHYYGQANWADSPRFLAELADGDYALMEEKLRLLDEVRAMTEDAAATPDSLRDVAQHLVTIEDKRMAENPDYVSKEQWMETVEGTAQYMGIMASRVAGYDFGVMYFDNTNDVPFADVVPFYRDGKLEENFLRDRLPYETGGQIALLLHALDPEDGWQGYLNEQTVEQPRTLIDALKHVLGE